MKSIVRLTTTAARHAESLGLADRLTALTLDAWAVPGDRVTIAAAGATETFVIRSRTIEITAEGGASLVFELDYPARSSGRSRP